jgi:hypothetical protein
MFRTLWQHLIRRDTRPVRQARPSQRRRLEFEDLEKRCLMSLQVLPVAPITGVEGQTTAATYATFTDSDAALTPNNFAVSVNFGDGTAAVTVVPTQTSPTTYNVTTSHFFAEEAGSVVPPEAFNVTVKVTDNVNTFTSSATSQAQISDAPLSPGNAVNPAGTLPTPTTFTGGNMGNATTAAGGLANFEAAIGGANNAGGPATTTGFRTINWDGVKTDGTDFGGGANTTVIVPGHTVGIPLNRFQSRGVEFGAIYAVSNDGFVDVNPNAAGMFPPFSPPSTFAMFNDNGIDFKFVVPSGPTPNTTLVSAASRGFGAIFINVELPGTTIQLFNGSTSLGTFNVPVGGKGQAVFLGELYNSPIITNALLTLGTDVIFKFDGTTAAPGPNADDGVTHNLTVVDDWAYAEPQPIANGFPIVSGAQGTSNALGTVTASPSVPFTGVVGTFSDADPNANAKDFTATINWGDGHSTNGAVSVDPAGGFDVTGTNTYALPGNFPINVDIQDFGGGPLAGSTPQGGGPVLSINNTAKVVDAALQVTAAGVSATEGTPFTSAVATFTDPDPGATAGDFSATITWGDGNVSTGTISANGTGFTVTGCNTYVESGNFTVNVTILDEGTNPGTASPSATVAEAPLTINGTSLTLQTATAFTGTVATFTDGAQGAQASDFTATITWGDGNISAGTITASGGSFVVSGTNTYAIPGRFTISVALQDEGQSAVSTTNHAVVGSANERLVSQLYHDLLERNVDVDGLAFWVGVLNRGGSTVQVVQGIEGSGEFRNVEVNDLYKLLHHRNADSSGLATFSNFLARGGTVEQVAEMITASPEYFQNRGGLTNDGFLTALYADALNRGVDAGSRMGFDNLLNSDGSRQQVAAAIFGSPEYAQDLVQSFYQKFLHRAADSSGLSTFSDVLEGGGRDEQVILDLVSSPEYAGLV